MPPTSRIEVDLTAIEHNVGVIRRVLRASGDDPAPSLCAVLKADGYGLGARRIARRLAIANVEMIAVFSPDQARDLIEGAINIPILILMPIREIDRRDPLYRAASTGQIHLAIHDRDNLAAIADITDRQGITLPVHLEVDTGMSRGGMSPIEATTCLQFINNHQRLRLAGVYTHYSAADSSDQFTRRQARQFDDWLADVGPMIPDNCLVHEANTFAMFRSSDLHRSMVRAGLALFGYACEEFGDEASFQHLEAARELRPAVRWLSSIVHIKDVPVGTPVGYGAIWKARRPSRIGLVPVGYADGYPWSLGNLAKVVVMSPSGRRHDATVVGRVSMDQITIDLTGIPENEIGLEAPVEIIGNDSAAPNHLPTLAAQARTITHAMLCGLSDRIPRSYIAVNQELEPERAVQQAGRSARKSGIHA